MSRTFSSRPEEWAKATLQKSDSLTAEAARGPVDRFGGNRFPRTSEELIHEPQLLEKAEAYALELDGAEQ